MMVPVKPKSSRTARLLLLSQLRSRLALTSSMSGPNWAFAAWSVVSMRGSCRLAPAETSRSAFLGASEATEQLRLGLPRSTRERPAFSPPQGA